MIFFGIHFRLSHFSLMTQTHYHWTTSKRAHIFLFLFLLDSMEKLIFFSVDWFTSVSFDVKYNNLSIVNSIDFSLAFFFSIFKINSLWIWNNFFFIFLSPLLSALLIDFLSHNSHSEIREAILGVFFHFVFFFPFLLTLCFATKFLLQR